MNTITIKTAAVATCHQCVHYRDDSASITRYYCEKIGRSFDDNDGMDYIGCDFITREQHNYVAIAEAYFQKTCLADEVVHHIVMLHGQSMQERSTC